MVQDAGFQFSVCVCVPSFEREFGTWLMSCEHLVNQGVSLPISDHLWTKHTNWAGGSLRTFSREIKGCECVCERDRERDNSNNTHRTTFVICKGRNFYLHLLKSVWQQVCVRKHIPG